SNSFILSSFLSSFLFILSSHSSNLLFISLFFFLNSLFSSSTLLTLLVRSFTLFDRFSTASADSCETLVLNALACRFENRSIAAGMNGRS
ncbi:hypothetical protein PFISCL1PPCAC_10975, partial [Pristionchus fissidentatus]